MGPYRGPGISCPFFYAPPVQHLRFAMRFSTQISALRAILWHNDQRAFRPPKSDHHAAPCTDRRSPRTYVHGQIGLLAGAHGAHVPPRRDTVAPRCGGYLGAILGLDGRLDGIDAKAPSAPACRSPRLPRRREARGFGAWASAVQPFKLRLDHSTQFGVLAQQTFPTDSHIMR